jgi:hypothetical protein
MPGPQSSRCSSRGSETNARNDCTVEGEFAGSVVPSARFDPVPVTASVLEAYWEIDHAEITAGREPRKRRIDLLPAATARSAGWTVWTADRADFSGVEHLVDVDGPDDESPPTGAR